MKSVVIFISVVVCCIANARVVLQIEPVAKCLEELSVIETPAEGQPKSQDCYDLALPFRDSSQLVHRTFYLRALSAKSQFENVENNYEHVFKAVFRYYQEKIQNFISPLILKTLNPTELKSTYEATYLVAFYSFLISSDVGPKETNYQVFNELVQRNTIEPLQIQNAYMMAIRCRDWHWAKEILEKWSTVEPNTLPIVSGNDSIDSNNLRYYHVRPDKNLFEVKRFEINKGPQILLMAGCHFAKDAIHELSSKKDVANLMTMYGFTIGPPDEIDSREIGKLATLYPAFKINPVVNSWAWWRAGIRTDGTPTLFFLRDGEVKYTHFGAKSVVREFCAGVKAIGIVTPQSCRPNDP